MALQEEPSKWAMWKNEILHNRCLMPPTLVLSILFMFCLMFVIVLTIMPQILLVGFLLCFPLIRAETMKLIVEHLYPFAIGRWLHFKLLKLSKGSKGNDQKFRLREPHSRTLEMRVEVMKDKLYIHMIPQFLDNVCYLIVHMETRRHFAGCVGLKATIVDCGDAKALEHHIEVIQRQHYQNLPSIEITSVLCTHKHHDHTAGNRYLSKKYPNIKIYGAVVEKIPHVTNFVENNEHIVGLALPKEASIRAIICPGHTRGSVVYIIQNALNSATHLFTGDVVFCGGGGEAFETHAQVPLTVQRCFANIIANVPKVKDAMLLPGHDYSKELLSMQLSTNNNEKIKPWTSFSPHEFFETASQCYVALHHRSLPSTKKILNIPCSLKRELIINPQFRTLRLHGESLIHVLRIWFKSRKGNIEDVKKSLLLNEEEDEKVNAPESTITSWNIGLQNVQHSVFTTFYTADLEEVVLKLKKSEITTSQAALLLESIAENLKYPLIRKSYALTEGNISDEKGTNQPELSGEIKVVKDALIALLSIGSPPQALTISDSRKLNMPQPSVLGFKNSKIPISKKRTIAILERLGLLKDLNTKLILSLLFDEALKLKELETSPYLVDSKSNSSKDEIASSLESVRIIEENGKSIYESCIEANVQPVNDVVELHFIKRILLVNDSKESKKNRGLLNLCLPCNEDDEETSSGKATLKITNLLYHDPFNCPICKFTTACPHRYIQKNISKQ